MNIQQLRYACELARQDLRVSRVAEALNVTQPGISTQLRLLEEELGVSLFNRANHRLTGITPAGREVLERAQRILLELDGIRQVGLAHTADEGGTLTIAASHAQARFRLPAILRQFLDRHPRVQITIRPDSGRNIVDALTSGRADVGIMSTMGELPHELAAIAFETYRRVLLVPRGHELGEVAKPSFDDLARYPMVLYEQPQQSSAALRKLEEIGARAPSVLRGTNADVVKAYVEHRLGICVLPEFVFDPVRDTGLQAIPIDHLFAPSTVRLLLHRKHLIRKFLYDFLALLSPQLTRQAVQKALLERRRPG